MGVELGILGQIEVRLNGQNLDLGHTRQRWVLAALLADANRPVAVDTLIERVWGGRSPNQARSTLYSYLSRIRRAFPEDAQVAIRRAASGYQIAVNALAVDLFRFDHLVTRAQSAVCEAEAMNILREALTLWRGEAVAGFDTPWSHGLREQLAAKRRVAELKYGDVALRLGHHAELIPHLSTRVSADPLDERLAGQLMRALYAAGRQAEALNQYQLTRRRLLEDAGVEPAAALRELHMRMLRGESVELRRPESVAAGQSAARVGPAGADGRGGPGAARVVPRHLPPPPGFFAGRVAELAELTRAIETAAGTDQTVVISAIGGIGGVGKTTLALQWAHRHQDRFPDGQLYAQLRGFDPRAEPVSPHTVVRAFLDALGVTPEAVPSRPEAQVGLYRSLVADRRMLIVLDNAADSEQVLPLLPGTASCTVIVTSRRRLGGITAAHGAKAIALNMLTDDEAWQLLAAHVGAARLVADPQATAEILRHCAGLPLAIGITGVRTAASPAVSLGTLAREFTQASARLDALDAGEISVNLRATFSASVRALTPARARLFGLLGLVTTPDFDVAAVASLIAEPVLRARVLLNDLEGACLIQRLSSGRYRMHDLVRLYAAERAGADHADEIADAERRLVHFYLCSAYRADRILSADRVDIQLDPVPPGCTPQPIDTAGDAMVWFDAEHDALLATQQLALDRGWDRQAWQIAWSLTNFHIWRARGLDQAAVWRAGLEAAERLGDLPIQSLATRFIGQAYSVMGDQSAAVDHLSRAVTLAEQAGDLLRQAEAHDSLGLVYGRYQDDPAAELRHATEALRLSRAVKNRIREAFALDGIGGAYVRLGDYARAQQYSSQALSLFREFGSGSGTADALLVLARAAKHMGQLAQAADYYQQAVEIHRNTGNLSYEAEVVDELGDVCASLGRLADARAFLTHAHEIYQSQHRVQEAADIGRRLARLGPGADHA
ncbi:AfsR/SARP family transcriptional regulator [Micromonospora zhanjiangensis]|uniref:BTAD domain-containing putative transcriptional regulator n=1 Tax=Micromonospora zhanjiangensis TaxID=1522057 RepID=A0ABV8KP97_9ACTN